MRTFDPFFSIVSFSGPQKSETNEGSETNGGETTGGWDSICQLQTAEMDYPLTDSNATARLPFSKSIIVK